MPDQTAAFAATVARERIYELVNRERDRQEATWSSPHPWGQGDCSSDDVPPIVKVAVLGEECGEVARAVLDGDPVALKTELVQVAAVCIAWLESFA